MDAILGHRPATQPPVIVNSMEELAGDTTSDNTGDTGGDTVGESQPEVRGNTSGPELDDIPEPSGSSTKESSRSTTPQLRKRKRSKADKNEASTTELISKLIKVQEESDKRLLQLEEKRLEFEKRQLEIEAQQRKEEREFQLKMMQLMMSQGESQPHYRPPGPLGGMQEGSMADHDRMYTFASLDTDMQ